MEFQPPLCPIRFLSIRGQQSNGMVKNWRQGRPVFIDPNANVRHCAGYVPVWLMRGLELGWQKAYSVSREFLALVEKATTAAVEVVTRLGRLGDCCHGSACAALVRLFNFNVKHSEGKPFWMLYGRCGHKFSHCRSARLMQSSLMADLTCSIRKRIVAFSQRACPPYRVIVLRLPWRRVPAAIGREDRGLLRSDDRV